MTENFPKKLWTTKDGMKENFTHNYKTSQGFFKGSERNKYNKEPFVD